jgi:hypothetical protein
VVYDPGCSLCRAETLTPWYLDEAEWWVADCLTCGVPMIVRREHGVREADGIPPETLQMWAAEAAKIQRDLGLTGKLDWERRQIPDHFHAHIRKVLPRGIPGGKKEEK